MSTEPDPTPPARLSTRAKLTRVIDVLVGIVFLTAAISKTVSLSGFVQASVALATVLPSEVYGQTSNLFPVISLVIATEVALGLCLIFGIKLQGARAASAGLLSVFSVFLALLGFGPDPVACGCLGEISTTISDNKNAAIAGILRNTALLCGLIWALFPSTPSSRESQSASAAKLGKSNHPARAFTLIEVLVSITIIALLIAIALPALRGTRDKADNISRLSDMRQVATLVALYTENERGVFPYRGAPGDPDAGVPVDYRSDNPNSFFGPRSYFRGQSGTYATALAEAGFEVRWILGYTEDEYQETHAPYYNPGFYDTYFWMTHATAADPRYWRPGETPIDRSMYRAMSTHETRFPSAKGLLFDVATYPDTDPTASFVTCDGAAMTRGLEPPPAISRPYAATSFPTMITENGMHGRDF